MVIQVAIVDDEAVEGERLRRYIEQYSKENGVSFHVKIFQDGLSFLGNYKPIYDIVFLDIKMPLLNGFDVSKSLYEMDKNVCIIFVTNMAKYAVKGYEVDALYFAVKPISYHGLSVALTKSISRIMTRREREIVLSDGEQMIRVNVSSIYYVEMEKHYAVYHTEMGEFRERTKMAVLEERLADCGFSRCNSGCLVNLKHVRRIGKATVVLENVEIPIARSRYKVFVGDFMTYLGGGGG